MFKRMRTRRATWLVGCLLIGLTVSACSGNGSYHIRPNLFWDSLFSPNGTIINGLGLTLGISVLAQAIGVIIGIFAAMAKMSKRTVFRVVANFYIWVFRGTPLLVQLAFLYFGVAQAGLFKWPELNLAGFVILPEILAGTIIMGINEGAYMAEIVRAGIIAVDPGQSEAAKSLGMTYGQTMRRIVLPQAARVIIPPLGNEFNNMLKTTSLLLVLSVFELYNSFSNLNSRFYAPFELFGACALWYLALTTVWSGVQAWIERRFSRGAAGGSGSGDEGILARMFGLGRPQIDAESSWLGH